jgi:uncharacterized protein (TIGR03067 family)
MRPQALLTLAIGLLIAADAPKDDATTKDSKGVEGSWVMVSGEAKGEKLLADVVKNAKLTIKADQHTVKVGDDTFIGTHKLNATTDPKKIDSMDTEGPFKGKTALGIYKLEGDEFTVCFAPPGKDRPKEFTTRSGTGEILHVWNRKKD